ncbi:MAG: exosortase/archaeosortase family protein [Candidatus Korobacteraceae bacterium]
MSRPSDLEIPKEESPVSKPPSFWQTVKPFGWQGLLLVGVLLALYAPVLRILLDQWYRDPDYSHGFLVPLLSAYLIWARRDKLRQVPRRPSPWGMVIFLGALGLLVLGSLGAELFLARFSLLCTICGLIVYFCGGVMLRALAFPMAFLLFAIPIPGVVYNEIVFPLQFIASKFATWTLEQLNLFPIMREGNVLILPGMSLEVVEACSGIRSLMSLLALPRALDMSWSAARLRAGFFSSRWFPLLSSAMERV